MAWWNPFSNDDGWQEINAKLDARHAQVDARIVEKQARIEQLFSSIKASKKEVENLTNNIQHLQKVVNRNNN